MTLVIGFGNSLRGDDGVGPLVATAVGRRHAEVDTMAVQQLVPEMAASIAQADLVVFIDAAAGSPPGAIRCDPVGPDSATRIDHTLSPAGLLALARDVFGFDPPAWLVQIKGASFDLPPALSPTVAAAVEPAMRLIEQLITA
jgi:hydrogenase maturation protease